MIKRIEKLGEREIEVGIILFSTSIGPDWRYYVDPQHLVLSMCFLSVFTSYPQCLEHKPPEGGFSFLFSVCSEPSKKGYRCTALAWTATAGISRAQGTSQGIVLLPTPGCQEHKKSPARWGDSCMGREGALPRGKLGQPECCLSFSLVAARTSTQEDEGRPPEWERESKWQSWVSEKREIKNGCERFRKKKGGGGRGEIKKKSQRKLRMKGKKKKKKREAKSRKERATQGHRVRKDFSRTWKQTAWSRKRERFLW